MKQPHQEIKGRVIPPLPGNPVILKRHQHSISKRNIDSDVLKIIHRLNKHGYTGFLTGASVQNLLQGIKPRDFDLVTDAGQNRIKRLYSNAHIIGRRFRLAHIHFKGGKIIELSTFRRAPDTENGNAQESGSGRKRSAGTPMEDAFQRDISINGLFYDVAKAEVIDYVQGLKDLAEKRIRVIADPEARFSEDAVRILRAIRHAARLGFHIEKKTEEAIYSQRHLLAAISGSRLFEEINKDLNHSSSLVFEALIKYEVLHYLIGSIGEYYQLNPKASARLISLLGAKDRAASSGAKFSPEALYAMLLWYWAKDRLANEKGDLIKTLNQEVGSSFSGINFPRKVRSGAVQTLNLLRKLNKALQNGRMHRSWLRHEYFVSASGILFLIKKGRMPSGRESFQSLLPQSFRPPHRRN
jgi:poly(A) polymerase